MGEIDRKSTRRQYLPTVEALESLRLLSGAVATLPGWGAPAAVAYADAPVAVATAAWDDALGGTNVADLIGIDRVDPAASRAGLQQLDRYLARSWYVAGVAPQYHEDCTQAVYLTLLENWGRSDFESLTAEVGESSIREVFSRDTPRGPDLFRAIDAVKKRAQRLRPSQTLDDAGEVAAPAETDRVLWRDALEQAMSRSLNAREADLVRATLRGESPMEIAEGWGLTPKTVSNEKTRVFQKLRESLLADLYD